MPRLVAVCFSTLIACCAASSWAQEWTRFRGPNGAGLSSATTIPTIWGENDYTWKAEIPGVGHSSPVIWGEKLFITSALEETAERIVLCYRTTDGEKLWERRFPSTVHHHHLRNSFASSTPAVDGQFIYLAWTTPDEYTLMALTHDGNDAWKQSLGPFVSQHSGGTSPIVYEDLVVINNDQDGESFLAAYAAKDGKLAWRVPRETAVVAYSTPCVRPLPGGGEELIFNSEAHGISGIDPRTGKTNWELKVFDKRSVSSPILAAGLVFGSCGSGGGGNYVVAVKPGESPEVAYKVTEQAPYVPTFVAKGDLVFLWSDKGIVSCIKAATGEVVWRERVGGNFSGSPVCVGDYLYCIAEDGTVVVLAAGEQYQLLAQNPLGEDSRSTPAVAGGRMFLRTYSHLFCVGKGS